MSEKLEYDIIVNGKKAKTNIKEVEKAQNDLEKKVTASSKMITSSWVKIGAAVVAVTATMKKSVEMLGVQAKAEKQLETAVSLNAKATEQSAESWKAYASALQEATTFGDEAIIPMIAYLKTLQLTDEQTKKVIETSMDLSIAMGMSLESAVMNLSKTFGGLAGELGKKIPALRTLTKEELKQGKAIDIVAKAVKGQAKAWKETDYGKMIQTSNTLGDTFEKLGEKILKIANTLHIFDFFNTVLTGIQNGLDFVSDKVSRMANIVKNALDKMGLVSFYNKASKALGEFTERLIINAKTVDELTKREAEAQLEHLKERLKHYDDEMKKFDTNTKKMTIGYKVLEKRREKIINQIKEIKALNEKRAKELEMIEKATQLKKKQIEAEQKEAEAKKKALEEYKKYIKKKEEIEKQFNDEYKRAVLSNTDYQIEMINREYEFKKKYVTDKKKLDEWYNASIKRISDKEIEDIAKKTDEKKAINEQYLNEAYEREKQRAEMVRELQNSFNDEYLKAITNEKEYELIQLSEKYNEYAKYIKDKKKLDEWYSIELDKIMKDDEKRTDEYAKVKDKVFQGLTDSFVKFAMTGKLSFKDMANSIIADLLRIEIQKAIVFAVGGTTIGSFLGLHTGGEVHHDGFIPTYHSGTIPTYHDGLRGDERLAKLQVGEAVIKRSGVSVNKDVISRINNGEKIRENTTVINETQPTQEIKQTKAEIVFNVQAIDSNSFNSYLINNRQTIEGIINRSLQTNGSVRKTIKAVV